ncbi:unnamed protein product [Rhizoctonia solani]|uniref:F-box domain-containing protein n=1 Tax=Rhizoctonia solani TaxID=456999 RepID=A0A8H3HWT4_9AGAM|nr:unnamed protein product [Rhizoctonia solani]
MNVSNYSPCPAINQWEKAGASLTSTLKNYSKLCQTLGHDSLSEGARPDDLATRISSALEVHAALSRELIGCTTALQKARNKLVSPFFKLPEEIISTIFIDVVYDFNDPNAPDFVPPSEDIWLLYRRLYQLVGVCTSWKYIAMEETKLWSMILFDQNHPTQRQVSLQRSGSSKLYLAAFNPSPTISRKLINILTEYGHRFYAINFEFNAGDNAVVRDLIATLVQGNTSSSLTELSIRAASAYYMTTRPPEPSDYIIPHDHPQSDSFKNILQNLTTFRTSGALIHWDNLAFSTRLVELWINKLVLGYDEKVIPFIQTLSSASNLRNLTIISVLTFHSSVSVPSMGTASAQHVQFPHLQSLFIQDIYFNTLRLLLPTIAPGSHRLTFFLSPKNLRFNRVEDVDSDDDELEDLADVDFTVLCKILEFIRIDTLIISGFNGFGVDVWLTGTMIYQLLKVIPTLKTLKLDYWIFNQDLWENIRPLWTIQDNSNETPVLALENLYLTAATIPDIQGFQEMVINQSLRRVVLGGAAHRVDRTVSSSGRFQEGSSLVKWLREHVKEVRVVHMIDRLDEVYSDSWRLW